MKNLFSIFYFLFSRPHKGQVVLFALFIIVSISTSAILYNRFFVNEVRRVITARYSTQALFSSDLGLERYMFYKFANEFKLAGGTTRCNGLTFDGCDNPYACTKASLCSMNSPSGLLTYYYATSTGQTIISSGNFQGISRAYECIGCDEQ